MSKMVCLTGSNYHIWKGKMKDLLFVKKMHLPVFASNKPQSLNDENGNLSICKFVAILDNELKIMLEIIL